ncbi:hypothetical protein GBAR_LOCUS21999, partial [Geodia barretti]
ATGADSARKDSNPGSESEQRDKDKSGCSQNKVTAVGGGKQRKGPKSLKKVATFYVDYDHSYVQASAKAKDVASSELSKSLLQEIMSNGPLLCSSPVTQSEAEDDNITESKETKERNESTESKEINGSKESKEGEQNCGEEGPAPDHGGSGLRRESSWDTWETVQSPPPMGYHHRMQPPLHYPHHYSYLDLPPSKRQRSDEDSMSDVASSHLSSHSTDPGTMCSR